MKCESTFKFYVIKINNCFQLNNNSIYTFEKFDSECGVHNIYKSSFPILSKVLLQVIKSMCLTVNVRRKYR